MFCLYSMFCLYCLYSMICVYKSYKKKIKEFITHWRRVLKATLLTCYKRH